MKPIAEGVWQLDGFPRDTFNLYLIGNVLIDAGTRWARWRILRQVADRGLTLIALTHAHPDHQGSAASVCGQLGIPLACHAEDVEVMEGRRPMPPNNVFLRALGPIWTGPPRKVNRVLHDGDQVADFRVVHAPGHTPGHVIYFRDKDRLAIVGDLLLNMSFLTGRPGLREPMQMFTTDPQLNRQSIRKLLALEPALICFGHGPPLNDLAPLRKRVARFAT